MKKLCKKYPYTLLFLLSIIVFSLISLHKTEEPIKQTTVTVAEGDTVWTIAQRFKTDKLPQEKLVGWIQEHNKLENGMIRAGDKLIVPSTIKEDTGVLASDF
ncbi:cell division suppressor protein YneA [Peribacillus kribbensis]|uniref:cell division suppressor protein YneA n=1 Tax=Peribacillus kribbensis TaxID=356658 RepID=UPI0004165EDF|nr:LysM peptidoglycan-binding domain-containing protein [Peribacillus kribbensis]